MNYYEVLDLPRSATPEEIRQAYRTLVEIHHPDRMQTMRPEVQERAGRRLKIINEAYNTLRDPDARSRYDRLLEEDVSERGTARMPRGEPDSILWERLDIVEQEISRVGQEIFWLRPRQQEMMALDDRWNRYLFASLGLALPFLFFGTWVLLRWAANPLSLWSATLLLEFLLVGYMVLFLVMWASRVSRSEINVSRLIVAFPLLLLLLLVAVIIGAPRTLRLLLLLGGYAAIIWNFVGHRIAEKRDVASIAMSRVHHLEEELYEYHEEKRALQAELARR